jgi:autotransporter-associated beta strand protein
LGVVNGTGTGSVEELHVDRLSLGGVVLSAALVFVGSSAAVVQGQQRVLGLDVSYWQTDITESEWATLKRPTNQQVGGVYGDGRDFAFIRASRGGTTGYDHRAGGFGDSNYSQSQRYDDPYFARNITRATKAGMFAGSYHFSRPDVVASTPNSGGIANTGTDEADHFIQMAGAWMRPGYLLPVHDLEAGDGIRNDNDMAQFALDFSDRIYEVMGIRPAIYTNGNYAAYVVGGASASLQNQVVDAYPTLWSARWPNQSNPDAIDVQTGEPKDSFTQIYGPWDDAPAPEHPWTFWQYASTARLNGNNNKGSNTDVNVARGGIEFLKDQLIPALWTTNSSGDWATLSNWNSGAEPVEPVPGPGQLARIGIANNWTTAASTATPAYRPEPRAPGIDDAPRGVLGSNDTVIIERASANPTITLSSGAYNIRKLYAKEALNITGGSLGIHYVPSADSTPFSAQFSAAVSISGGASLSVHTLEVDATRTFTVGDSNVTLDTIHLGRHASTPAKISVNGNVNLNPLNNAAATISATGSGSTGTIDLTGGQRTISVANGAAAVDLTISLPVVNGGLTKAGGGTLALTGSNTYSGDTIIEAGRLSLAAKTLANASNVYLLPGSSLELTHSGSPDVINALFLGGVMQDAGTWGAIGSGAQYSSPLLIGTGILQVSNGPTLGDFNRDGYVDGDDLGEWEQDFGSGYSGADFLTWQREIGNGALEGAAVTAVPEPTTTALGMMALVAAGLAMRKTRRRGRQA